MIYLIFATFDQLYTSKKLIIYDIINNSANIIPLVCQAI